MVYEASLKELNWKTFTVDVIVQFGPGTYDNPMG